jgi:GNAT superfamily N-acetyltransferase
VVELAENANTYTPLGLTDVRVANERFVLWMGRRDEPSWNVAQRLRLTPDTVAETVDEVHAILRERGRGACSWEVGSAATPPDIRDRLLALGMSPDRDPHAIAMVLMEPPAQTAGEVDARPIATLEEYVAAERVARIAFDMPEGDAGDRAASETAYAEYLASPDSEIFLAYVDGEPAARGSAVYSEHGVSLFGGATLPHARGRGAYRALVAARWDAAVARGKPALVTQAGAMSRPILERLGFRAVAEIWILIDEFGL